MGRHNKEVKLQSKYRSLVGGDKRVPWLTSSGNWLESRGFREGATVRITTRHRLLVIEPLDEDEQQAADYKASLEEMKATIKRLTTWK